MRIAVDVMGGDHGPSLVIEGVRLALTSGGSEKITELYLVGLEQQIQESLTRLSFRDSRLVIIPAADVLTMEDKPLIAIRQKKDCSVARALDLVKDGKAEAVISLGNTGGLVAAATVKLRRLQGVDRPAIATLMPSATTHFVLIDAGANPECKPLHLLQFAVMGSVYAREMLGHAKPRVGILSNGTEEMKGNELTREALKLCQQVDLNFIGYVEGHDLFADRVEVVVTDGFVGNIVLKTCESMGKGILRLLKSELTSNPVRKFGAMLAAGAFRNLKGRMDPESHGGAPLLGLNGCVIKVHGSARERVVMNAIRQTTAAVGNQLGRRIIEQIAKADAVLTKTPAAAIDNPVPA